MYKLNVWLFVTSWKAVLVKIPIITKSC